jgi:hypothetical protein
MNHLELKRYLGDDRIVCKIYYLQTQLQIIQPMGPLPQTPNDIVVALMLAPFIPDQSTMCDMCVHGDEIAAEAFQEINHCLNGPLAMEDTFMTIGGVKARPIRK